ncbi:CPBP family intramembrane metalloprotease [Arachidicoccus ginsenosidivorans]|uniref:CPBP family intramembrane metalloprotease n=1 Tax=Arachidicoccus ginsenosidivorans TaxID=496057 RepID=A0A5B8VT14_9BACT|nr:CPBP family intramembrane metalloprotease [Arachidicoccus ginsenosidivorans]
MYRTKSYHITPYTHWNNKQFICLHYGRTLIQRVYNYVSEPVFNKLLEGHIHCRIYFSAGHIYSDPIHYIIAFLGGVTLGFAYYKTQSLYYCMGIHFMYNLYNYLFTSAINEKPNTLIRPFIIKYEASILSVDKIDLFICMTFIGLFLYLWYKLGHREGLDRFAD